MTDKIQHGGLAIDSQLYAFINDEVLAGLDLDADRFWSGFEQIVNRFHPQSRALVAKRQALQKKIDAWHLENRQKPVDLPVYKQFLQDIGYLVEPGDDFVISTENVDAEVAKLAGPQLVVPVNNARYALNAANARWGSLYDALYGTDAIEGDIPAGGYDPSRGAKVIAWGRDFLDSAIPLLQGSHGDAVSYEVVDGGLLVKLAGGGSSGLKEPEKFVATGGNGVLLFVNNGLHIELKIDRESPVGRDDPAGISDIVLEAALSSIMDCEDSVAAVDGADKVVVYRNWLELMTGRLESEVSKAGRTFVRQLAPDRVYQRPDGSELVLPGRALMFARNVGLLMTTPAITNSAGEQIAECIMDCYINAASAMHDKGANSRTGSIYFVAPKLHGPEEAAFMNDLLGAVEAALGLARNTIKMGIMDEERRTSVNLKACIRAARERVCFVNTGFLDRTGDEIHTSMQAGPMVRKGEMKSQPWISAYEDRNVDIALACGFAGRAQIGKGMWAMPDLMADMLAQKQAHLEAGANTAWVPSPVAATLHATHYHRVNVAGRQREIARREPASLDDLLTIPLADGVNWSDAEIAAELDNNAQGILGYMVRWVEQGIGCSKVPDIHNIGLMEDRATLRISSQHMANWLLHGVVTKVQVLDTLKRMAAVVDAQNAGDPHYCNMTPDVGSSLAFIAACDLVFKGAQQPSGYTEPVLHARRLEFKESAAYRL